MAAPTGGAAGIGPVSDSAVGLVGDPSPDSSLARDAAGSRGASATSGVASSVSKPPVLASVAALTVGVPGADRPALPPPTGATSLLPPVPSRPIRWTGNSRTPPAWVRSRYRSSSRCPRTTLPPPVSGRPNHRPNHPRGRQRRAVHQSRLPTPSRGFSAVVGHGRRALPRVSGAASRRAKQRSGEAPTHGRLHRASRGSRHPDLTQWPAAVHLTRGPPQARSTQVEQVAHPRLPASALLG